MAKPLTGALLAEMQNSRTAAMLMVLAEDGITAASYIREVRAIASAAAEQSDFSAAMKGYELIGKALGSFAPEVHHHILTPGIPKHEDLARLSDAELERLAYESAKPAQAEVISESSPPVENLNTHVLRFSRERQEEKILQAAESAKINEGVLS